MQAVSRFVRRTVWVLVTAGVLVGAGWIVTTQYGWLFSKNVHGEILRNERVTNSNSIISGRATPEMLHSYTILIREEAGSMITASSEDRQWAVVASGMCVIAKLYPYPPWELDKGGTYGNARLEKVYDCPGKTPSRPAETAPVGGAPEQKTDQQAD